MKLTRTLSALLGTLALATATLDAQNYTEIGDAGQTLGNAQNTGITAGQNLTTISGSILSPGDADLFRITITTPMTFSATTTFGGLTTLDTALFLFNGLGQAIYTNDDASGASLQSTLPAGTSFTMSLAAGTYYLAISLSGNEPVNLNGQLLFAAYIGGDPASVRGPAAGVNPNTLNGFNGATSFAEMGSYRIDLTGAATAVPEPSTTALFLAAVGAATVIIRRRKSRALLS